MTLVCFAIREEAAPFRKIAAGKAGLSILITGIGRQNAGKSAREFLARHSPALVLTCGFAGGLNPALKLGDVVFETFPGGTGGYETQAKAGTQMDPAHVGCRPALLAARARPAKFFCADRIATTVAEKKKLLDQTGADAVEMESAAIHAVCRQSGIPCATVRVISDPASEDLPLDFNALSKPDQSLDYRKLAWAVARSPGKIGDLMRLGKNTRFAAEQLAEVLAGIIP